jgi:hypothetical protein
MLMRLLAPDAAPACQAVAPTAAARAPGQLGREPGAPSGELIVAAVAQVPGFDDPDALLLWRRGDGIVVSDPVAIVDRLRAPNPPAPCARRGSPGGGAVPREGRRRDAVVAERLIGDEARALETAATRLLRDHLGVRAAALLGGPVVAQVAGTAAAHVSGTAGAQAGWTAAAQAGGTAIAQAGGTAVAHIGCVAIARGNGALPAPELVHRLTRLARDAARARDQMRLDLLDRALQFLRRGHTAGEAMLAASLRSGSDAELIRRLALLPGTPPQPGPWRVAAALAVDGAPERPG